MEFHCDVESACWSAADADLCGMSLSDGLDDGEALAVGKVDALPAGLSEGLEESFL
jgi:hypothetical protein